MSYQEKFPKILEKTYGSCKDVSVDNTPAVKLSSMVFGERIISLPFLDTIDIVDIPKGDLSKGIYENAKIEIRLSESNLHLTKLRKTLKSLGFKENFAKGHIVSELTTENDFWERFEKQTRKSIKKAEKSGLEIKKINSIKELRKTYDLYFKQMKRFGSPQHSFDFFLNCLKDMGKDFSSFNCYFDGKIVGSIINFINNETLYVAITVSDINFKKLRASDLLYWESIKWCMRNKIKYFDIGQIDMNPEEDSRAESLLNFKKKWLGKEYKRIYFTRGFEHKQGDKDSLKKFRKVWKFLPNFIIKLIGPKICSQLG